MIFLGDYIDRGPAIRETLQIVRRMVEGGFALALCGNHELDVLMHDTSDGHGGWLRPHEGRTTAMHAKTHAEFAGSPKEWHAWLRWFQSLPLYLDLPGLRAVHAYWNSNCIAALGGRRCVDDELLHLAAARQADEGAAVHLLLKGPEVPLPIGFSMMDPSGCRRDELRVRWWEDGRGKTYREACINRHGSGPDLLVPCCYNPLLTPPDPYDCRPVFLGHYWLPPQRIAPLTSKIACLDFSVAAGGPLVSYQWDGERELRSDKFVFKSAAPNALIGSRSQRRLA